MASRSSRTVPDPLNRDSRRCGCSIYSTTSILLYACAIRMAKSMSLCLAVSIVRAMKLSHRAVCYIDYTSTCCPSLLLGRVHKFLPFVDNDVRLRFVGGRI